MLNIARAIRTELARQGVRVVMTRDSDANPSFDDRAGTANAIPNAVYITMHIASTGTPSTARVYFYRFASAFSFSAVATGPGGNAVAATSATANGLLPWDEAQRNYVNASHRFADILQASLGQKFTGSPAVPASSAVRELRSIASPAVAIELSSISVPNPALVGGMAAPLASAIAQSVAQFQSSGSSPSAPGTAPGGTP